MMKKKDLIVAYIQEHAEFKEGDKVKVTSPNGKIKERFGIVGKPGLDWNHKIQYPIKQIKKDGTPGLNQIYTFSSDKIEKI